MMKRALLVYISGIRGNKDVKYDYLQLGWVLLGPVPKKKMMSNSARTCAILQFHESGLRKAVYHVE